MSTVRFPAWAPFPWAFLELAGSTFRRDRPGSVTGSTLCGTGAAIVERLCCRDSRLLDAVIGSIAELEHHQFAVCYTSEMRAVDATYVNGCLLPAAELPLRDGARVRVMLTRRSDPSRWRFVAAANAEDVALAEAGLSDWLRALDDEDGR